MTADAVREQAADAGVGRSALPANFGDAAAEYRAVRKAAGVAERRDRAWIRLWGRDPVRMVQGLITSDLAGAPEGRAVYGALLTPKGRMVADLRAFRRQGENGDEVVLDLPGEALAGACEHLGKYVPPMFARWEEAADAFGMLGVYGPEAHTACSEFLGDDLPRLAEDEVWLGSSAGSTVTVIGTREWGGEEGYDLLLPPEGVAELRERLLAGDGARAVGRDALEALRIEAGRPAYGAELSEEVIPTEAWEATGMMERGISFTKGCYTGQEVIIRIAHRGHVNRHLRGLLLGDAAAPPGSPLFPDAGDRNVGRVTSVTDSPLLGQRIGLGYVRRELAPGDKVRVGEPGGERATVVRLPFAPGP